MPRESSQPSVDRLYRYVGPAAVRAAARGQPGGTPVATRAALVAWLAAHPEAGAEAVTFVVDPAGVLRLAPRRSEHVACAGGAEVRAAGEIAFARDGRAVRWCSNQSSGYCPEPASVHALGAALRPVGIAAPAAFDAACVWRRCPGCGQTSLVKDDDFTCACCAAALPAEWNFADEPAP